MRYGIANEFGYEYSRWYSEHGEPVSSLEFVPRTLKRRKHEAEKPSISSPQVSPTLTPQSTATRQPQDINPSWDFAFLVWLALSDYCFFADDIPDDPSRCTSLKCSHFPTTSILSLQTCRLIISSNIHTYPVFSLTDNHTAMQQKLHMSIRYANLLRT